MEFRFFTAAIIMVLITLDTNQSISAADPVVDVASASTEASTRHSKSESFCDRELASIFEASKFVFKSKVMREVAREAHMHASFSHLVSRQVVLIYGETGSGKEAVAEAIHKMGERRKQPFVRFQGNEVPDEMIAAKLFGHEKGAFTGAIDRKLGVLETANGGTLFIDEIHHLSLDVQAKLLSFLQSGRFTRLGSVQELTSNVDVIVATNQDLLAAVKKGTFLEDLYFRIMQGYIEVPPLRAHKEDIPVLAEYFMKEFDLVHGTGITEIDPAVMSLMLKYDWSGNVRELRSFIRDSMKRADYFGHASLNLKSVRLTPLMNRTLSSPGSGGEVPEGSAKLKTLRQGEIDQIGAALKANGFNRTEAAKSLGISLKTLHNKLKEYRAEGAWPEDIMIGLGYGRSSVKQADGGEGIPLIEATAHADSDQIN